MAYFRCSTGSASSGDGVALVVQCDANFAGSVITATNGTDTFTETCPSVSPYTVRFEGIPTGTYTISGVSQGQTFTTQFTVLDYETTLNATPEGATVLPINDIQIWLNCANIWDKNYTTLDEVLADNTTLLALINSNNAVDYMVRSTEWSGNGQALVPTMTSNTTPSGECFDSLSSANAYKAFNGSAAEYLGLSGVSSGYVGYDFGNNVGIAKVDVTTFNVSGLSDSYAPKDCKLQYSNDKNTWHDASAQFVASNTMGATVSQNANVNVSARYWRVQILTNYGTAAGTFVGNIQFYNKDGICSNQTAMGYIGNNDYAADTLLADATWCEAICNSDYFESVLNVKVPTMTSDTAPSGVASTTSVMSGYSAYLAFDNNDSTYWLGSGFPQTLYYEFPSAIKVYKFSYKGYAASNMAKDIAIVNGDSGDTIIQSYTTVNQDAIQSFIINSPSKIQKWGLKCINAQGSGSNAVAKTVQFYGRA